MRQPILHRPASGRRALHVIVLAAVPAAVVLLTAAAPPAPPAAPPPAAPAGKARHEHVVRHIRTDGEHGDVTVRVDDGSLTIASRDGDRVETTVVDLDQIGQIVGEAVAGAMAALDDLQVQVRVGQDNRVNVSSANGACEVDINRIATGVAAAVRSGLHDVDTEGWTSTGPAARDDEEALRAELLALQDEMRALRSELHRLRDASPPAAPAPARR